MSQLYFNGNGTHNMQSASFVDYVAPSEQIHSSIAIHGGTLDKHATTAKTGIT
jgi:hypothetical protein